MADDFENRINELYERSVNRGIFTFTDFLSPSKQAEAERIAGKNNVKFFGGSENCERVMARFGNEEELGYDEEFPIKIVKITVTAGKFATEITHRDVLGAVLNLGIDRNKTGDIIAMKNAAYIFVADTIAELVVNETKSVSRNPAKAEIADEIPEDARPKTEEREISVASNRADAVISRLYGMSREESLTKFKSGFVAINGKPCEKNEKSLSGGDVVTVRGNGKFVFIGEGGTSKKGKLYVKLKVYI